MSEIRIDPFSGARVIFSPERENRPDFTGTKKSIELSPAHCPFCSGNEEMTPPEIYRIGDGETWKVRVIPNKFPVLKVEGKKSSERNGVFRKFGDAGAHEIIVETPAHTADLLRENTEYFENILSVYRERIRDLKKDFRLKYIQVFKNYKAPAGATISHHHSQLIALPFVPAEIKVRLVLLENYYKENGRSLFTDVVSAEIGQKKRIICQNDAFLAFAPWCSKSPFQVSVIGKSGNSRFEDIGSRELTGLSEIFGEVQKKLVAALGDPPMNIILNNAPFEKFDNNLYNWTFEFHPVLGGTGGFESATGTYINSVFPEKAADILKKF